MSPSVLNTICTILENKHSWNNHSIQLRLQSTPYEVNFHHNNLSLRNLHTNESLTTQDNNAHLFRHGTHSSLYTHCTSNEALQKGLTDYDFPSVFQLDNTPYYSEYDTHLRQLVLYDKNGAVADRKSLGFIRQQDQRIRPTFDLERSEFTPAYIWNVQKEKNRTSTLEFVHGTTKEEALFEAWKTMESPADLNPDPDSMYADTTFLLNNQPYTAHNTFDQVTFYNSEQPDESISIPYGFKETQGSYEPVMHYTTDQQILPVYFSGPGYMDRSYINAETFNPADFPDYLDIVNPKQQTRTTREGIFDFLRDTYQTSLKDFQSGQPSYSPKNNKSIQRQQVPSALDAIQDFLPNNIEPMNLSAAPKTQPQTKEMLDNLSHSRQHSADLSQKIDLPSPEQPKQTPSSDPTTYQSKDPNEALKRHLEEMANRIKENNPDPDLSDQSPSFSL